MTEYCNGPGHKEVFSTKDLARAAMRTRKKPGGKAYRCPWGDHFHYTSHKKPRRQR